MARRVAWVGVALGVAYLVFIGGAWWGIYTSSLRLLTMLIAGVTLAIWFFVAARNRAWRPRTVMWPAIAACVASLAVSTVFSREPRVSAEYLGYAVVLAALYLLLVRLFADAFFQARLVALLAMLFGAITALYVGSVIIGWIEWWRIAGLTVPPLRPNFEGLTFGNPSAVLTMAVLLGVPLLAWHGEPTRRGAAVIAGVALIVTTVAVMSGSRAGWFALGVTFVAGLMTIAAAPTLRRPGIEQIRSLLRRQPVVLWLPVVILLVEGVIVAPAVVQRVFAGGESFRLTFAVTAVRMFATSPIVGTGPGTFVIQRPAALHEGEPDEYGPHAHNLEVQTLAELGVFGAIAGVILLATILRVLRFGARAEGSRERRWSWFAAAGFGYFFLHQLLDFYPNMPAFLFAAAAPVAYLDARASDARAAAASTPRRLRWNRLASSVAATLVMAAVVGLVVQEVPALRNDLAVADADEGEWRSAVLPSQDAVAMDPEIAPYQFTAGLVASANGDHAAASRYFENVLAKVDLPEAWIDLAAEQAALGNPAAAHASILRGLRLGQQRPPVAMAAGDLALRIGDRATAMTAFASAVSARPSLAADPWWSSNAASEAVFPDVISGAIARNETGKWEVELMAGRAVTTTVPLNQQIAAAWRGDTTAVDALVKACDETPLDLHLGAWCARVLRHLGDATGAERFTERSRIAGQSAAEGTFEWRVTQSDSQGFALSPFLWPTYTYRRSGPQEALVDSLIHLHLE